MSPRPKPTREDPTARHFLDAAAQLIEAMFIPSVDQRPRRLRTIKFPAALEWLRIEDIIQLAAQQSGQSIGRRAFLNRWQTKEAFIRDAIIHTMLSRDQPEADFRQHAARLHGLANAGSLSQAIIELTNDLLDILLAHPRSFLLLHVGPMLDQHPELRAEIIDDLQASIRPWYEGFAFLLDELGAVFRPGWTIDRFGLVMQAMLDGFVLRSRLQPEQMEACRWQDASLFADAVIAFTLGVLDADRSSLGAREALDQVVRIPRSGG